MSKITLSSSHKEAKITLLLAVLYVIGWCICAYLPENSAGPLGFPLWFELACIYLPILSLLWSATAIKIFFKKCHWMMIRSQNESWCYFSPCHLFSLYFGAALYAYSKRHQGDFLTEYYVGNRSMTGF